MSLSDKLWGHRAERLHEKFVEASEQYSKLYHVAVRTDVEFLWRRLLPCWDPDGIGYAEEGKRLHADTWQTVLMESRFQLRFNGDLIDEDPHRLRIQGEGWVGRFVDPDYSQGEMEAHEGIDLFQMLGEEATSLLHEEKSPLRSGGSWFSEDPAWLEELYVRFALEPEDITPMKVVWLPWNVFASSARAIELLIDKYPVRTLKPAIDAGTPKERSSEDLPTRPAYKRDHLWLDWKVEGLGPAAIRDRWDGLSDEERKAHCATAWEKVGEGGKEAGREVVKAALKKAAKERGS